MAWKPLKDLPDSCYLAVFMSNGKMVWVESEPQDKRRCADKDRLWFKEIILPEGPK